jgi:N-acetyl-anhydromuramyl-L-alanine amidase AmpD
MARAKRARTHLRRYWRHHLVALVVAGAVLVGAIGYGAKHYVTYKVRGPHGRVTLTVPAAVVKQTTAALTDHRGLRDQSPPGAPPAVLKAAQAQDLRLAAQDKLPLHLPDVARGQRGCITRLVVNYSSRNGVAPHAVILHYTVSRNITGWADNYAIIGVFNTPAYQVSSNYVYDAEGHCAYIVREPNKAWTQAAANPFSISFEVIDTGFEKVYLPAKALAKLAMIISDVCYRWHIPVQLGAFVNGKLTRYGIMDHRMLGVAGGGHHDIAPRVRVNRREHFDNAAGIARVRQVIAAVRAYRAEQAKVTRARRRARARAAVVALRRQHLSWAAVKATPQWRLYVSLGGH